MKREEKEEVEKRIYHDTNLQIAFAITLVAVLGVSSISPAFPEIQEAFGISKPAVGLLIVVFTLPGVLFTPVLDVLADCRPIRSEEDFSAFATALWYRRWRMHTCSRF